MTPFEFLYFLGLSAKKRYCLSHQKRLPRSVVSIGNLTLGGTGKTPAVIALSREAVRRGLKPCVLTRGYKGKSGPPCFVSRGEGAILDPQSAGDEAVLMAEKLKGVPIVKGRDRHEAGMFAMSELPSALSPDLFILDDGFQHWRLGRDRDVVLIDGSRPFGNGRMLPLGTLREPVSALSRADIIVITKSDSSQKRQKCRTEGLVKEIKRHNSVAPVFSAGHMPSHFVTPKGDTFPLEWSKGKKFFAFCGIGNHASFKETLISTGIDPVGFRPFGDHHEYSPADLNGVIRGAGNSSAAWIVTTEKDIMRLKSFTLPENLVALAIEFRVDEKFYDEALKRI